MDIRTYNQAVDKANQATYYYDLGQPIMSDADWDKLYFDISAFEVAEGIVRPDSPTQTINYEVKNELTKVTHNHEMLSLDKSKDLQDIVNFISNHASLAMAKMDGLTCSLLYENGELVSAETRGNGTIGEDITHNAKVIPSILKKIPYKERMIIDGEIICTYDNFIAFNNEYKNPRNFAAGSIRLLDAKECSKRNLTFVAWDCIEGIEEENIFHKRLDYLKDLGFITVPYVLIDNIEQQISEIQNICKKYGYPIDGIVIKYEDVEYSKTLGQTAHHFKNAIAYKFYDETYETQLKDIEWTMGRTGVLTPVAIFNPIEIDGTTIERASLHNVNIMEQTLITPYKGEKIEIFKSNAIIPQVVEIQNFIPPEEESQIINIINKCPICGGDLAVETSLSGVKNLVCQNPTCAGKLINRLDHFCGKKGLDIRGLSKATLEKLIDWGWVFNYSDIFTLETLHKEEWYKKPGFGVKSVNNILNAINESKNVSLENFISAIGIPLIGLNVAKELIKYVSSYEDFKQLIQDKFDFSTFDTFGFEKSNSILTFDYQEADNVYPYLNISLATPEVTQNLTLEGKTIVITGKLHNFKNRGELENLIASAGGKVSSSISSNTFCLINNDINSTSAKNIKAKSLKIPICTEEDFCRKYLIF